MFFLECSSVIWDPQNTFKNWKIVLINVFFSPNLIGHYNQRVAFNPRSPCTTGCSKSLLKGLFSWLPSLKLSIHQENHVLHLVWSCLNINYLKTILKVSLNSFTQKISGLWSERQAAYSPSPVFEEKNDHSPQPNTHPTKPTWADTMLKKTREIAPVVGGVRRWSEVPAQNRAMSLVQKIPPKLLLLLDGSSISVGQLCCDQFFVHILQV